MSNTEKMGDPLNLSTWTLIDNEGEIVSGDIDSESSDSSIEVVTFNDGELATFSRHLSSDPNKEISDDLMDLKETLEHNSVNDHPGNHESFGNQESLSSESTATSSFLSENFDRQAETDVIKSSLNNVIHYVDKSLHSGQTIKEVTVSSQDDLDLLVNEKQEKILVKDCLVSGAENNEDIVYDDTVTSVRHSDHYDGSKIGDNPLGNELGACCLDLLLERSGDFKNTVETDLANEGKTYLSAYASDSGTDRIHFSDEESSVSHTAKDIVSLLEEEPKSSNTDTDLIHLSEEENTNYSVGRRTDSDTDSDFVRLDCGSLPDLDIHEITVPIRISTVESSVCPSFSFLRNADSANRHSTSQESTNREAVIPYEEDVDDDTESSTEEGVDDRIESEQSEAGSLSAQNDIGDLSVFADIGDLPLDAGNVPRNYIHSPNNHLSTILNVIVFVAAILTMGISLGIIVGTDLEIEEWQQTVYQQSMKIILLEQQLKLKSEELSSVKMELVEKSYFAETWVKKFEHFYAQAYVQFCNLAIYENKSRENGFNMLGDVFERVTNCERAKMGLMCDEGVFSLPPCEKYFEWFIGNFSIIKNEVATPSSSNQKPSENTEGLHNLTQEHQHQILQETHQAAPLAEPVMINIKDLQQSLTREQQRALHWQNLYLSERRQKERERENEEWEDERDRELWENEHEHLDQVDCLKKLMAANVTRLTQHISQWNFTVFDDFANLSLLLSGVAELKQSVIDSLQNVWDRAEEMLDNVQKKNSDWVEVKSSSRDFELLYVYVTHILQEIGELLDEETLLEYLRVQVNSVIELLKNIILSEPSSKNILLPIQSNFEHAQMLDPVLDTKKTIASLIQLFYDLQQTLKVEFGSEAFQSKAADEMSDQMANEKHNAEKVAKNKKNNSWPNRLGILLKKTSASVRDKVKNTWQKIKSIWHNKKTTLHKLKNYWHEKKPSVLKMAQGLTDHVINVSSKFKNLCTSLPLFNKNEADVNIYSRSVSKARKQWQKDILHEPCKTLGKFSTECNSDRKQLKKNIKKINHKFIEILKLFNSIEVQKLKPNQMKKIFLKIKSFQDDWGSSGLLLKTDLDWVTCQRTQWFNFINKATPLDLKSCNTINLEENLSEQHCERSKVQIVQSQGPSNHFSHQQKLDEQVQPENTDFHHEKDGVSVQNTLHRNLDNTNKTFEFESKSHEQDDWYLKWANYRVQSRKEHDKSDWIFQMAADREKQRNEDRASSNWVFQKADHRKQKRREAHRNDWLFERAHRNPSCDGHFSHCETDSHDKSKNWFEKHDDHRENMRRQARHMREDKNMHRNFHSEKLKRSKPKRHHYHSHSRSSKQDDKRFHSAFAHF
ncbi:uncharacterized protein LOC106070380 isoform X2 [Biomphalaria glabrata]|uniref:Uncharacterized protein LOC106070380 isoform X2 n=1 Tax=Biomphalaria glabrata TaxID=6526 RepID=A0A9W3AHR7_BIOGL|nr:uncharacterized protein LOC106070380 isoform X2 [Biomphalaria glabrata]XP_055886818.1 uncharacterized protein LOC106070380 isoform X2 [Biomphalaria glabrata]XP_055886825.1 uncharacterized protein LOC106070380 isoform X2 [Biomphalaria glabrata]XP_055886832.1 uncharacterized protein LOC106070380 isoform X2 [Biomphalaria glabrata]